MVNHVCPGSLSYRAAMDLTNEEAQALRTEFAPHLEWFQKHRR